MIKKMTGILLFVGSIHAMDEGLGLDYGLPQIWPIEQRTTSPSPNYSKLLLNAIMQNDSEEIEMCAKQLKTISQEMHHPLLMALLHYNDAEKLPWVLDILMEHGVGLDVKDTYGLTPLHYICSAACEHGDVTLLELFLRKGADCQHQEIKSPYQMVCNDLKQPWTLKVLSTIIAYCGILIPASLQDSTSHYLHKFHALNAEQKESYILKIIRTRSINTPESPLEILLYHDYFEQNPLSKKIQAVALEAILDNHHSSYLSYFFLLVLMQYGLNLNTVHEEYNHMTGLELIRKHMPNSFLTRRLSELR